MRPMTRLLQPPPQVALELGPEGAPARLEGQLERQLEGQLEGQLAGHLEPVKTWRVEQDWWERPVARQYWKVLLGDRLLLEVFHDLLVDAWFLERIYD